MSRNIDKDTKEEDATGMVGRTKQGRKFG